MKCYEVKFVDNKDNVHVERLCTVYTDQMQIIRAAWKNLFEAKNIAATVLVGTFIEVETM